jgi:hypothetical protein
MMSGGVTAGELLPMEVSGAWSQYEIHCDLYQRTHTAATPEKQHAKDVATVATIMLDGLGKHHSIKVDELTLLQRRNPGLLKLSAQTDEQADQHQLANAATNPVGLDMRPYWRMGVFERFLRITATLFPDTAAEDLSEQQCRLNRFERDLSAEPEEKIHEAFMRFEGELTIFKLKGGVSTDTSLVHTLHEGLAFDVNQQELIRGAIQLNAPGLTLHAYMNVLERLFKVRSGGIKTHKQAKATEDKVLYGDAHREGEDASKLQAGDSDDADDASSAKSDDEEYTPGKLYIARTTRSGKIYFVEAPQLSEQ